MVCWYFVNDAALYVLSAVSLVLFWWIILTPSLHWSAVTLISFFGKFFIATIFLIAYTFTATLFPTELRGNAISLASTAARVGNTEMVKTANATLTDFHA